MAANRFCVLSSVFLKQMMMMMMLMTIMLYQDSEVRYV